MDYRFGASSYTIRVQNPHHIARGVAAVTVDGRAQPTRRVSLRDDGRDHAVTVLMGAHEMGAHEASPSPPAPTARG